MKRRQLLLSALAIATIGAGLLVLSSWLQGKSTPSLRIEEEDLTPNAMGKLIPLFKERNPLLLLFSSPNQLFVLGPGDYDRETSPLLIFDLKGRSKVVWLNNPSIFWLDVSPDGRLVAYEGPRGAPGIWVLDMNSKEAKLEVPYVRNGKILSLFGTGFFIDSRYLVVERVDEKLWRQATQGPYAMPSWEKYLNEKEKKRVNELFDLFLQGKLREKEAKELTQLMEKGQKLMSEEEKREEENKGKTEKLAFASLESFLVDVETGEERLIASSGQVIGVSQDNRWLYVLDKPSNKVFKVKIDEPSQKEELLPYYYQGLRIGSEEPLRFGYQYPASALGLFSPPSALKCYCYEKKNDKFALVKTIDIGDKRFPRNCHISVSPNADYSLAYGEKMFIKDLKSGKIWAIEDKGAYSFAWAEDNKLAYVVKGKDCFEVWLYDVPKRKKQRIFP